VSTSTGRPARGRPGEVRRVGSAGRSADRPDLTGYRQPAEPFEEEEPAAEADFADTWEHLAS
jgi:hypothetical protein